MVSVQTISLLKCSQMDQHPSPQIGSSLIIFERDPIGREVVAATLKISLHYNISINLPQSDLLLNMNLCTQEKLSFL